MRTLLDSNIIIHALNSDSENHAKASEILSASFEGDLEAVVSPQVLYECHAVMTDPRRVQHPLKVAESIRIMNAFLQSEKLEKIEVTRETASEVMRLVGEYDIGGASIFDCVLAVTMRQNGVKRLYTENKRDFDKFNFIEGLNPFG